MRDLINIIMEKSRGLLYRDAGDSFFQGSKDNPTAEISFDKAEYYPSMPGAYANYEEMAQVGQDLFKQYPAITWSNKPTQASKAFAILTFNGPAQGEKTYFGRFFNEIKQDMAGFWKNSELPGGWQLNKAVSLKGSYYKLKPADLFPPDSTFDTPEACVASLESNPKQNPAVPVIMPGMQELLAGKFPKFDNVGDMATAVRDDLGETIGPIAMVQGMNVGVGAEAARKDILGPKGTYAGSAINFPASKINGLVDSYLLHPSGVEIGVSSKGEKGASASVKNIADGIVKAREKGMDKLLKTYEPQVKIIEDIGKASAVSFPLAYGVKLGIITQDQAKIVMDLIGLGGGDLKAQKWANTKDRDVILDLAAKMKAKTDNPRYNMGYHVLSVIARDVAERINSDPKFGEACLKFLNTSPIVQLHLNGSDKGGNYQVTGFTSKYPPDFKGTVGLDATKVYSATGIIGRMSFSYNGAGAADTDVTAPEVSGEEGTLSNVSTADLDAVANNGRLTGPGVRASKAKTEPKMTADVLGRERRK